MKYSFNEKVVVAHEDPAIRKDFVQALKKLGYEAVECSQGSDVLEMIHAADPPRVIWMGLRLPQVTPSEIGRKVRETPGGKCTYLGILVSASEKNQLTALFESGVNDYLTIPLEPMELRVRMQIVIRLVGLSLQMEEGQARMIYSSKMASLGQMAAGISHEINNPLAIISGSVDQILRVIQQPNPNLDFVKERCEKLKNTVKRITKIIFGLKTFAGESSVQEKEVVDAKSLIEDALSFCEAKLKSNGIEMRLPAEGLESQVICNRVQVCQVIVNLLNNSTLSIKTLPDPWIEIKALERNEMIEFTLTDSGGGIPKAIREKIMEPFFSTRTGGQGTGLGLSISKGIIEAHGGRLWLDEACPNTRFVFSLPRKSDGLQKTLKVS